MPAIAASGCWSPGPWLDAVPDEFCRLYAQQLDRLDARAIVARIEAMAAEAGASAASLACYESPSSGAWCHRAMVSHWLHDRLGLEVHELGHEQCGCGARHPLRCRGASDQGVD